MNIAILIMLTALCWFWLWFMVARREKWVSIVDRENAFWERLGASASFTEKVKRIEKGIGQKVLVGAAAVIGTALCVWTTMKR